MSEKDKQPKKTSTTENNITKKFLDGRLASTEEWSHFTLNDDTPRYGIGTSSFSPIGENKIGTNGINFQTTPRNGASLQDNKTQDDGFQIIKLKSEISKLEKRINSLASESSKLRTKESELKKRESEINKLEEQLSAKADFLKEKSDLLKADRSELDIRIESLLEAEHKLDKREFNISNQQIINDKAKEVINDAYRKRERVKFNLDMQSFLYAGLMIILIFLGLAFLYQVYRDTMNFYQEDITMTIAFFYLMKNAFLLSAYGIGVKVLMSFSDKYFKASSLEEDRIHNMTYGKFYVETYAPVSNSADIKEALSGWREDAKKSENNELESLHIKTVREELQKVKDSIENLKGKDSDDK